MIDRSMNEMLKQVQHDRRLVFSMTESRVLNEMLKQVQHDSNQDTKPVKQTTSQAINTVKEQTLSN